VEKIVLLLCTLAIFVGVILGSGAKRGGQQGGNGDGFRRPPPHQGGAQDSVSGGEFEGHAEAVAVSFYKILK